MKVLIECFIPTESGPVFSLGLATALKNNGLEVFALLCNGIENEKEWKINLGYNNVYVLSSNLSFTNKPWKTIRDLINVKNFFREQVFDFWIDTFPYRCWRVSPFIKYKSSFGIDHDVVPHSSSSQKGAKRVKKCINRLDNVIVLSKMYIPLVEEKYGISSDHVYYMRHGAMQYSPNYINDCYDDKFDINFLYFGRIDGYKGLNVLAKSYQRLKYEYSNISLTVAGGGDFSRYEDIYKQLKDCTVVNKYLSEEEISFYFNKPNTVLVLPYLDASQSGVLAVAFNYNTPVIVSNTEGLREQLFDGAMGLFVEPGNDKELYERMKDFLIYDDLYNRQTELMKKGLEFSTWDYCVRDFLKQIRDRL